ncbi:MAG: hypothetical protein ACPGLV_05210 [Bacteroidia bacterium]
MRNYIIIALIGLLPFASQAQSTDTPGKLGFSVNTAFNGEFATPRIIPNLSYTKGNNQYDLGIGFQPFNLEQERLLSIELSEKHYPNGLENKYNMYFLSRAAYVNIKRDTYYPSTYNYLFLNAGYGFDVNPIPNFGLYLGTNMTLGVFTYSKQTDTPNDMFQSQKMFSEFGYNLALQASVGFRF